MAEIVIKDILEAGVHFGHRCSRWNPKMRPYIHGKRNLIHIIDIKETVRGLLRAKKYLQQVASQGSLVLFVGTKRQAADPKLTRGEALRQAMMALADGPGYLGADGKTEFAYAHPLFWAPYSIIGDGGGR